MTGFGEACREQDGFSVRVEIRAVNARYLKIAIRSNNGITVSVENEIENLVRQVVRRGTVNINIYLDHEPDPGDYRINQQVLLGYFQQLSQLAVDHGLVPPATLDPLLTLPGVVSDLSNPAANAERIRPNVLAAVQEALDRFQNMRITEGQAMAEDLRTNCTRLLELVSQVESRAPLVVDDYRQRLQERMAQLLGDAVATLRAEEILKEASFFAERSDISEELVRLRSHVEQIQGILNKTNEEAPGRRMDFLSQEMLREINTMGAKANDVTISHHVVEMKAIVERIREMVQNVE
ncbi:MAG: YicC/YloC family endoribonuclease [Thermogutta sp.]